MTGRHKEPTHLMGPGEGGWHRHLRCSLANGASRNNKCIKGDSKTQNAKGRGKEQKEILFQRIQTLPH